MSEIDIDKLNIEVSSSADSAEASLDRLIKKLRGFKTALKGMSGVDKIVADFQRIKASADGLGDTAQRLSSLAQSLNTLKGIKLNVTNVTNSLRKISEAANAMPEMSGFAQNINSFSAAVTPLSALSDLNINKLVKNLTQLPEAITALEAVDTQGFADKLSGIAQAVTPLSGIDAGGLKGLSKFLKEIPDLNSQLDSDTLQDFAAHMRELTASFEPLLTQVQRSERGLVALNSIIQANVRSNGNLSAANAVTVRSYTSLSKSIGNVYLKIGALVLGMRRLTTGFISALKSSNEYIENLNLFNVTMGKGAEAAYEYAQQVNRLLGIDISDWIRNQGTFMQIVSGFGVVSDKAELMSKNLTQIGYDISSFYNVDIETAMQKVQSGIAGELEPLRRLGCALDAATLQQVAYNHGITQNISTMTQAQKSQLRYIAIIEQSKNVMGDMARTINTPANSMRILNQQWEQFKRAVGNIVSVIAVKLIPYLQAAVRLLTEFANWLAKKWGFELPEIDYSSLGDGLSATEDSAVAATDALNDLKEATTFLAGFDEMEIIPSDKTGSGSGSGDTGSGFDLGIELPEYDFLAGVDKASDEIYRNMRRRIDDLIGAVGWLKKTVIDVKNAFRTGSWVPVLEDLNTAVQNIFGDEWTDFWEGVGEKVNDAIETGDWYPVLEDLDSFVESVFGENWTEFWGGVGDAMYEGIENGDWEPLLEIANSEVEKLFGSKWTKKWEAVGEAMHDGIKDGNWYPFLYALNGGIEELFGSGWTRFWEGVGEDMYTGIEDGDWEPLLSDLESGVRFLFGDDWVEFWEGVGESIYDGMTKYFSELKQELYDLFHPLEKFEGWLKDTDWGVGMQMINDSWFIGKGGSHAGGFASGGYPTTGQIFYAREDGMPEMVGRIGTRTAVANNDQITTAIAMAVRQAMAEAMMVSGSQNEGGGSEVHVYIDGKEVTGTVIDRVNSITKRNGKSPLITGKE